MDLLGLAELATLCALGDRAALFLDFEQGAVCMMAGGRSVPLYARLAGWGLAASPSADGGAGGVPGKLFVIDINLGDTRSDWGGDWGRGDIYHVASVSVGMREWEEEM